MAEAKDENGVRLYEQNWYAVAMSDEVAAGASIGADYLDGRVVVWRGEDGVARVMNAWCAHLGADLSVGQVVGNDIRCAFHHWQYGDDGVCTRIPAGDKIPPKARVTRVRVRRFRRLRSTDPRVRHQHVLPARDDGRP
jgi:phenylpropionate dioxygenase-like ring-hydroxylating dioxygenase large terminal subunit